MGWNFHHQIGQPEREPPGHVWVIDPTIERVEQAEGNGNRP